MGVTVIPARRLVGLLRSLPPSLTPERAREVAAQINRHQTRPAAAARTIPAVLTTWSVNGSPR
jgi:hypothetical protein